jgi:predicted DNA-binding ArsR family transcriptional regulator
MGTPAKFLENAHECVELAKRTTNTTHRKLLVDLAVKWLQLG